MIIGIDISQIAYGTGVGVYTENLVKNLLRIDQKNKYVLISYSLRRRNIIKKFLNTLSGNFDSRLLHIPITMADFLWNRLRIFKIERLVGKIDVLHTSDWIELPSNAFKVTTIHDLSPLKFSDHIDPKIVAIHQRKLELVAKEVNRVIVPSLATKKDVIEFGISEGKIRVIPEAVDPIFARKSFAKVERVKKKYKIEGKYLLSVGVGFRKNTDNLVNAFAQTQVSNIKLVIIGRKPHDVRESPQVTYLGFIPNRDVPYLYSGAEALVYPSLSEGFGLPILEAFACGCPVVTSDNSSLKEIADKATILVNPADINSISNGIERALKDKNNLVDEGYKRLKDFSWEESAKKTLAVYNEAF